VFLFGHRPRSIVGSGYSRSISAGGSWRPYLLVFRVWLIRSLTPPKTELPATIANRRPKLEKYRGTVHHRKDTPRPDRVKLARALAKKSNDENLRHRKERCHLGDRALHQGHTLPSGAEGSAAKRNPEPSGPHTVPKVLAYVRTLRAQASDLRPYRAPEASYRSVFAGRPGPSRKKRRPSHPTAAGKRRRSLHPTRRRRSLYPTRSRRSLHPTRGRRSLHPTRSRQPLRSKRSRRPPRPKRSRRHQHPLRTRHWTWSGRSSTR
jgi:hypothetical protein